MDLGNFSISLTVKDLTASIAFYEKLGFKNVGGDPAQGWVILQGSSCKIGLFQGMFDKNILTFNPGWDGKAQPIEGFTDIRDLQKQLKADGVAFVEQADESTSGPAHFIIHDPDGNPIMVDQHV
ncbi:MAG: VOC family protein [Rhodobacteraceae bacterium]|nr:VOC family protein [Paracoccaceae bacterium]